MAINIMEDGMSSETASSAAYRRAGWLMWLLLTGAITTAVIVSIFNGQERSVTPAYRTAVENWFAGKPLYNMYGHGFLYLPQAALTFAPWAFLPHIACELIWRWTIIGVLAGSLSRLVRLLNGDGRWFLASSLVATTMAYGCARNGQSTLMITGLMLLATADLSERRWWRATILLSTAFAFKPLAIVLILLAAAIYRPMSWRIVIGLIVVALVPFATQRPEYVMTQYRDCVQSLKVTFDVGERENWAQLFSMLKVAGLGLPAAVRTGLRLGAAIATLGLCWQACRRLSPQRSTYYIFSLATCYLMLFNSRTEGNTYAMVGPVYGALLAEAMFLRKDRASSTFLIAAVVLSVLNFELAILVTPRENAIWISPLVCLGVTVYVILRLLDEVRNKSSSLNQSSNANRLESGSIEQSAAA